MAARSVPAFQFVCPPNWPQPPAGWIPPEGWQPEPAWGPAPPGWQFWQPSAPPQVDGFAVATLIAGVVGSPLLAVIFGGIALSRIRRRGRQGRNLVFIGMGLAALWVVGIVVFLVWGSAMHSAMTPTRSPNGTITAKGKLDSSALQVGDCVKLPITEGGSITLLDVVPCGDLHNAQVVNIVDLGAGSYPGDDQVSQLSRDACQAKVTEFVKANAEIRPGLRVFTLFSSETMWKQGEHRSQCLVADVTTDFTGDVRGR